jgi:hypothetical protein
MNRVRAVFGEYLRPVTKNNVVATNRSTEAEENQPQVDTSKGSQKRKKRRNQMDAIGIQKLLSRMLLEE